MKFIDSAKITVIAGNGGDGCISFQKNGKISRWGKPDGSNGGDGGDICLITDVNISTLNYFIFNRVFKAQHGSKGRNKNCTGKRGKDLIIKVPQGTRVHCSETHKLLFDVAEKINKALIIAKGGRCGLGNYRFKYNHVRNQQYKNFLQIRRRGLLGESRHLLLELILIADVGIFGLPNSGKSSFLNIVSKAKPKIANYPFTTLVPNLGTVQLDNCDNKFVIADIPGIIKGASMGSGLGIQFLKHLERCNMLLHFVDIYPADRSDPIENILTVEQELYNYNKKLTFKNRWLVFNKIDLLNKFTLNNKINHIIRSISWKERYYSISVINNINIKLLCHDIMQFINSDI